MNNPPTALIAFSPAKFLEAVFSGLTELWSHKMRSLLTLFGIIVGTISLIVMTSLVSGARDMVKDIFSAIGWDGVLIVGNDTTALSETTRSTYSRGLQLEDVRHLRERAMYLRSIAPVIERMRVIDIQGDSLSIQIRGTGPDYLDVRNRRIKEGRFITGLDEKGAGKVCVISEDLADKYFYGSAVGRELVIYDTRVTIIGVVEKVKNDFDGGAFVNEANVIMTPLSTMTQYFTTADKLDYLAIKIDVNQMDLAVGELERILEVLHHGVKDFSVDNIAEQMAEAQDTVEKMMRNWNIILGAISSASLLVGGIGILSIMLISISERIFEIGLRKSLGATNAEIFLQFLIESVTLSVTGALTGAAIGMTIVMIVATMFPFKLSLSEGGVALAMLFAISIGLAFGYYPAHKAGALQPVDALRH
ncbi:ABC transporter permease [bacterium]|nr:ABC transporter permease [candidate division CSSED10-310 bacterium]